MITLSILVCGLSILALVQMFIISQLTSHVSNLQEAVILLLQTAKDQLPIINASKQLCEIMAIRFEREGALNDDGDLDDRFNTGFEAGFEAESDSRLNDDLEDFIDSCEASDFEEPKKEIH